jgi:GNAT superfamily N-acetyltransferase
VEVHELSIRPARVSDLPALTRAFAQEHFFAERLQRQRAGRGVLLVAWIGNEPVGDIYVWLEPAEEPEVRAKLPNVALLNHLEVHAGRRNSGIGTALLEHAEELLRNCGHRKVALGVSPANGRAARLYERLGYHNWPHPDIETHFNIYLDNGERLRVPEICRIFVKDLE